jgi:hypothetical protein
MAADIINNDLVVNGNLSATTMSLAASSVTNDTVSASAAIGRAKLALETKKYDIPLTEFRVWDAVATTLSGTPASYDLGLVGGTFATDAPIISSGDCKNTTTTRYARAFVRLPAEYDSAGTVTIRLSAGMKTTVGSSTCTIDVEARKFDKASLVGSDLCATAATTINSLTFGDKDFSITSAGLVAGDILDVRVAILITDVATATAVIGAFASAELLCQVRG